MIFPQLGVQQRNKVCNAGTKSLENVAYSERRAQSFVMLVGPFSLLMAFIVRDAVSGRLGRIARPKKANV